MFNIHVGQSSATLGSNHPVEINDINSHIQLLDTSTFKFWTYLDNDTYAVKILIIGY